MSDKKHNSVSLAELQEYDRVIRENKSLISDLRVIRGKYRLPMSLTKYAEWMDEGREYLDFIVELKTVADKYSIPIRWHTSLLHLTVLGHHHPGALASGLPIIRGSKDRFGNKRREIIITEHTDINDPEVREFIKYFQAQYRSEIPSPIPVPGNTRGKLDWRPVLEWKLKHPGVTHRDIAEALGYSEVTVRRKLSEIDNLK